MHSRAVLGTSSQPCTKLVLQVLLLVGVQFLAVVLGSRSRGRPAESRRCRRPGRRRVSSGVGCTQSTMALMSSRGVKYCPAPFGDFPARSWPASPRRCRPSRRPASTSTFSASIRSTISRRSVAGFWISCRAFLKISPEHARLLAEFFEDVAVVDFQFVAVQLQQALPAELRAGRWACGCTAAGSARRPS